MRCVWCWRIDARSHTGGNSEERAEYFAQRNADQIEAVEGDMLRENAHPTMTIGKPERQSRVTFGGPKK